MTMKTIVVETDVFTRTLDVILNPQCDPERMKAFKDFFLHDVPDFDEWLHSVRSRASTAYPANIVFVDDQDALHKAIPQADAVVVEGLLIGEKELSLAPRLKVVQKYGYVLRNIDVLACSKRNIDVLTLRRRANIACAEQALMLMLALAKRLPEINKLTSVESLERAGFHPKPFDRRHTPSSNWARIPGISPLHGATLGIIGLGEIGREVTARAAAFGMRVCYTQRTRLSVTDEQALGVTWLDMNQLLEESDWILPQLPATPATEKLLGAAQVQQMKFGARIVNVSRAQVMDRQAVIDGLKSGHIGGLGLDTLWSEPGREDDELLAFPNVILTPHVAGSPRQNATLDFEDLVEGLDNALSHHNSESVAV